MIKVEIDEGSGFCFGVVTAIQAGAKCKGTAAGTRGAAGNLHDCPRE